MELHKTLTLDPSSSTQNTTPTLTSVQSQHAPMAIPINQLAMKPIPLIGYNGLNGIAGLNGINGLNGLNVPVIDSVAAANQKIVFVQVKTQTKGQHENRCGNQGQHGQAAGHLRRRRAVGDGRRESVDSRR